MSKKVKFDLDKYAISLVQKVVSLTMNKSINEKVCLKGSLGEKNLYQMQKPIRNHDSFKIEKSSKGVFAIFEDKTMIGFLEENLLSFEKLVEKAYSKYTDKITLDKFEMICFKWIVTSKKEVDTIHRISTDFSTALETNVFSILKDYKVSYKILNIEISKNFELSDVLFWFVPKNYFSNQQDLNEQFKGNVFVSTVIKGVEISKAKELAYEKCCYAVDVFKTLYNSFIHPHEPVFFEIDNRCKYHQNGISLTEEIGVNFPCIGLINNIKNGRLEDECIDWITSPERHLLVKTVEDIYDTHNELNNLVRDSVKRFSEALSSEQLHMKIVSLMTIWVSLLLPNEKSPIKHTLLKYGPKLIHDSIIERRELSKLINKFYGIRSDFIHHSKQTKINPDDTFEIQKQTLNLIIVMLNASLKFQTKKELLDLIDLEMEKSFRIGATLSN